MDNIKKFESFLDRMQGLLDNAKEQGHIIVRVEDIENAFPELTDEESNEKHNGGIVMEDFNDGNGFYKVNLAYLNKEQVEQIEELARKWNQEIESEDEKIRKALIRFHKSTIDIDGIKGDDIIAWLEKQGEQKFIDDLTQQEAMDIAVAKCFKQCEQPRYSIGDILCDKSCITLNKDTQPNFEIIDIRDGMYICDKGSFPISQQDEYELVAKKIVPKFQNGQWIVWQNKCYKVNYNGCGYGLIDQNGLSTSLEYGTVDKSASAFTIKDAKDGDVLVNGSNIFIFHFINGTRLMGYCHVNTDNGIFYDDIGKNECFCLIDAVVNPATKEQRDLLFQKMKEAGYEWDSEKKELKKISQRTISAEAKEALYDKPTDEEMKELLRTEYEKGRADTIAEMEREWSEEDEKMLEGIVNTVKDVRCQSLLSEIEIYDDYIDWLKSIKQRI